VQERLGYTFRDLTLLDCALTHKSYANEAERSQHYERLEFLGDAVVGVIISAYLYTQYPDSQEGELSKLRARVVSTDSLAAFARAIDLGEALRLGRGEEYSGGREKPSLLAAALEAVVAAVYLDGGLAQAQQSFVRCFAEMMAQRVTSRRGWDYKGMLQEYTLSALGYTPTYRVVSEEGPPHQKTFHVRLSLNQEYDCLGRGPSKKAAEQHAAQQLLTLLQHDRAQP
jgi:ribonuclease-3